MLRLLSLSFVFACFLSCGKYENVKNASPEMTGDWTHYSENDGFHSIYIRNNGRGSMYGINDHDNNSDPQERGWYIKDDVLYFSRFQNKVAHEKFAINKYPVLAELEIVLDYDVIPSGNWYMVLNERIYRKTD